MEAVKAVLEAVNSRVLWGPPMVAMLLGTGLFLGCMTGFVIFRRFGTVLKGTVFSLFSKRDRLAKGGITPFQAVCTALAGTVGTGNIVGVALAIATGGPGAIFWLWISALVGMVVKFGEVTLCQCYRRKAGSRWLGGPMEYIEQGLGCRPLALAFSLFGALAAFGIGASVQANSMAAGLKTAFGLRPEVTAVAAAVAVGLVILGGIRRIAGVAEILVPVMAVFYMGGAAIALTVYRRAIPEAFSMIFSHAFTGTAAAGGFLGASARQACRIGMARGVFTHEAGMGSAPIAHAEAHADHPVQQGLWGAFEVFFDSLLLCTVTALVVLTSGVWQEGLPAEGLCAESFARAFPGGGYVVSLGLSLFAFATAVSWYHYGRRCVDYLGWGGKLYPILYIAMVAAGCLWDLEGVWAVSDLFNGLMAIPNLVALIALSPVIRQKCAEYFRKENAVLLPRNGV